MHASQNIHFVSNVRADRYSPNNSNAVTIEITTDEGSKFEQTLFFGRKHYSAGKAAAFFYALGGDPADVIGSQAEADRDRNS